jgi:hypothetical protein
MYLLSGPMTNISGIYKNTVKTTAFHIDLPEETVERILSGFEVKKKFFRHGEYFIIRSWPSHQNWKTSPNIKTGIINNLIKFGVENFAFLKEIGYEFDFNLVYKKLEIPNPDDNPQPEDLKPDSVEPTKETELVETPSRSMGTPSNSIHTPSRSSNYFNCNGNKDLNLNIIMVVVREIRENWIRILHRHRKFHISRKFPPK